jgi:hypothetical protein
MDPGETLGPEVSETLDIRVKAVLDTISVSTKQWRSTGASIRHSHEVVEKRFSLAYEELNTDTRPEGFMQRPEMSQLIEKLETMDRIPSLHTAQSYMASSSPARVQNTAKVRRAGLAVPLTFWLPLPSLSPITPPSLASESQAARYHILLSSHRTTRCMPLH